jgi:hypothetical protein
MFLSAKKLEGTNTKGGDVSFECLLPLDVFWELEKLFKHLEYLLASGGDPTQISELTQKIMKKTSTFVVNEKERIALREIVYGKPA